MTLPVSSTAEGVIVSVSAVYQLVSSYYNVLSETDTPWNTNIYGQTGRLLGDQQGENIGEVIGILKNSLDLARNVNNLYKSTEISKNLIELSNNTLGLGTDIINKTTINIGSSQINKTSESNKSFGVLKSDQNEKR